MKIEFIENGRIKGWVVAFGITLFNFFFAGLAFFGYQPSLTAWEKIGDKIITLSVWLIGIWFASKRTQDLAAIFEKMKGKILKKGEEDG